MKSRIMIAVVLMAGTVLAQGPAGAAAGRRSGRMGGPMAAGAAVGVAAGNLDALKAALNLTDVQVQQLKDLRKQEADAAKPIRDQIQTKRQALAVAMKAATPDSVLIGQLIVDIRKLGDSMKAARTDSAAKSVALLTPDQQTKLAALEEARKLMPAVGQATALGLLAPPQGQMGAGMGAGMANRGQGRGARLQRQ